MKKYSTARRISKIMIRLIRDNRGFSETTALIYALFLFMIFVVLYVDLYGYFYTKNNLRLAVDETLTLMKAENGYDSTTKAQFRNVAVKLGLNPADITILEGDGYTTPKTVARGEPVQLTATMPYRVRGLKPFGQEINLVITISSAGLAQSKLR